MEHRWGQRWDVQRAVHLRTRSGLASRGEVRNVSISGAFIVAPLPVRLLSYIQVHFVAESVGQRASRSIEGQVVRRGENGFALEWCEFAPDAVFALASSADGAAETPQVIYPLTVVR